MKTTKTTRRQTITRRQTSFRLSDHLLEMLKKDAARNHRSLNNYVEHILMESVEWVPNAETLKAIYDAEHDIDLEPFDFSVFDHQAKKSK